MKLEAKQRLIESAKTQEPTATLLRSFLVKRYGAKAFKSLGMSNPYASDQSFNLTVAPSKVHQIAADFEEHGWTRDSAHLMPPRFALIWPQDTLVRVIVNPETGDVRVQGRKGAKSSNLPLYD